MSRDPYVVKDWSDRLRPLRSLWCRIVGHAWQDKMYDQVCHRCQISRRTR